MRQPLLSGFEGLALPSAAGDQADEAYTPPEVLTAARLVLGGIDLDPASCRQAQQDVQARQWYGLDHPDPTRRNGLALPWAGSVWLNPPFSDPLPWVRRLVAAHRSGAVPAAVVLVRADPSTEYSQELRRISVADCWPRPRLRFLPKRIDPATGRERSPDFGTILWYIGDDPQAFIAAFSSFGDTR